MLGFWIALAAAVAGVLGALVFYAAKVGHRSRPVETMNPRPPRLDSPRRPERHMRGVNGHPRDENGAWAGPRGAGQNSAG
jgi:hypothetical protein